MYWKSEAEINSNGAIRKIRGCTIGNRKRSWNPVNSPSESGFLHLHWSKSGYIGIHVLIKRIHCNIIGTLICIWVYRGPRERKRGRETKPGGKCREHRRISLLEHLMSSITSVWLPRERWGVDFLELSFFQGLCCKRNEINGGVRLTTFSYFTDQFLNKGITWILES